MKLPNVDFRLPNGKGGEVGDPRSVVRKFGERGKVEEGLSLLRSEG